MNNITNKDPCSVNTEIDDFDSWDEVMPEAKDQFQIDLNEANYNFAILKMT